MSITILPPPKNRERRICTYDMEWIPKLLQVRLVGFVGDDDRYHAFTGSNAVRDFLDFVLTPKYAGASIYAHAGGLADIQFVFEELIKDEDSPFTVDAVFSGSSAIIVRVRNGNRTWTFLDSFWTLQSSLKKIGEALGMPKGEVEWFAPLPELVRYNEQDCRILREALREFQRSILDMGSELMPTAASTSLRLFRRRYLQRPIQTDARLNHEIRPAYAGGRVEPFTRAWHDGWYYDVNSSYPHAMTLPLPGSKVGTGTKLARGDRHAYVAKLTVTVPEMDLPPLPYTEGQGLYFPTGTWTSWFCGPEIELAEELGVTIEKVHKVHVFELRTDLAEFSRDLYERRLAAKGTYLYHCVKIVANSGYGKFGEEREKQGLVLNPTRERLEELRDKAREYKEKLIARGVEAYPLGRYKNENGEWEHVEPAPVTRIQAGVFLTREATRVPHAHVPIAAYVTSYARVNLYRHMARVRPYYCDTDGFGCDRPDLPTSDALGDIKLEKTYTGYFHAPKLYRMEPPPGVVWKDEKGNEVKNIVKGKGFSRSLYYQHEREAVEETDRRLLAEGLRAIEEDLTGRPREVIDPVEDRTTPHALDPEGFERLTSGEDVWVRRMRRIRELYARGETRPEEIDQEKGLIGARPKRRFNADGTSVPWDVKELEAEGK